MYRRLSIEIQVVKSRHCNSGYKKGDVFVMDIDGNFISKLCPKRMCVYLVSHLDIPVALINERVSEGLDPNAFHFTRKVTCSDVGVECLGYGEVMVQIKVVPRKKYDPLRSEPDLPNGQKKESNEKENLGSVS